MVSIADETTSVLGYSNILPKTARTRLTRLIPSPLEAAATSTHTVAGTLAPAGVAGAVGAVAATTTERRMIVSRVPHFAPILGGFAVLTPGMKTPAPMAAEPAWRVKSPAPGLVNNGSAFIDCASL